jgi:hypothetical protein
MGIDKINVNEGYYTPDSEKDSLESAHMSGEEVTLIKNEKKIIENKRTQDIEGRYENDLLPSKEGVHIDYMEEEHYRRQPYNKGKDANENSIRKERKNSINRKIYSI